MTLGANVVTIATHPGDGHPDDVFFVAIMQMMVPYKYGAAYTTHVIRTREPAVLAAAHYVGDVGKVLRHTDRLTGALRGQYDHHQIEGAGARPKTGVPYAAAGLAWSHFGAVVVEGVASDADLTNTPSDVASIVGRVDRSIIEAIDARDNGLIEYQGSAVLKNTKSVLNVGSIAEAIALLLRSRGTDEAQQFDAFMVAVNFATRILTAKIIEYAQPNNLPTIVKEAYDHQLSGRRDILVIDYESSSANQRLRHEIARYGDVRMAVFPSRESGPEGQSWRVVVVENRFLPDGRLFTLPHQWLGLEADELRAVTGIQGAQFCHRSGIVAGATSMASAIELAALALRVTV